MSNFKPTALKILEGNPGKRPLNLNEPKPRPIPPKCPKWLSKKAKEEWKRTAPILERIGLLTEADRTTFILYCQTYAKWEEAEQFLKEKGTTYAYPKKDKDGNTIAVYIAPYPQVAIARQCADQLIKLSAMFGFDPSSRGRMSIPGRDEEDDPLEELLRSS